MHIIYTPRRTRKLSLLLLAKSRLRSLTVGRGLYFSPKHEIAPYKNVEGTLRSSFSHFNILFNGVSHATICESAESSGAFLWGVDAVECIESKGKIGDVHLTSLRFEERDFFICSTFGKSKVEGRSMDIEVALDQPIVNDFVILIDEAPLLRHLFVVSLSLKTRRQVS